VRLLVRPVDRAFRDNAPILAQENGSGITL